MHDQYLVEKRFSTSEINRVLSAIEQLQNRLSTLERWNVSYLYDRLNRLQLSFHQFKKEKDPSHPELTEVSFGTNSFIFPSINFI